MPTLKEIPIAAHVAWCHSKSHETRLVLGRRDAEATLDFVDIDLGSTSRRGYNIPISVSVGGSMGCLNWSPSIGTADIGLLAGGFEDGAVKIWNPSEFFRLTENLSGDDNGTENGTRIISENSTRGLLATSQSSNHRVTCMEFNQIRPSLIACGHSDGGLNIINVENIITPEIYEPGLEPIKAHGNSAVTAVAWNKTVEHIAASTCASGSTVIWNLRQRKASIKFRDPAGRLNPSSVAWLPNQATQVIVAYDDDSNPSFQMWDLRNASYPFKEFPGHTRGILDIQFSELDPALMLSCGRDNRTVCWSLDQSANAPSVFSDFTSSEWQRAVRWAPCLPGLIASSSHIEGVFVESVQERRNPSSKYVPKWFQRPAGVSFGFGGKLVSFNTETGAEVTVDIIPNSDIDLITQADNFELTLLNNDYISYCEKKLQESDDDHERLTWQAVETLFYTPETRPAILLECLGFKQNDVVQAVEQYLGRKPGSIFVSASEDITTNIPNDSFGKSLGTENGIPPLREQISTNVNFFPFSQGPVDAELFFNELGGIQQNITTGLDPTDCSSTDGTGGRDLDTNQSAVDASVTKKCDKEKRGSIEGYDWNTGPDLLIKKSFLIGHRTIATEMCIEGNRWADALLLSATSGDSALWDKTKELYLQHKKNDKFLQMIGCVIISNWDELVRIADLSKWEETLALIVSYVPTDLFPKLSEDLGLRLEREMFDIRAAVVCYLLAGSFQHASQVWSSLSVSSNRGKSFQKSLQDLVEKLTILKRATNYQHEDPIFNQKVSQYAEILANSGRLVAGMKFLCLVGPEAEDMTGASVLNNLRHRIYHSAPEAMRLAGIPPPPGVPFISIDVRSQISQSVGGSFTASVPNYGSQQLPHSGLQSMPGYPSNAPPLLPQQSYQSASTSTVGPGYPLTNPLPPQSLPGTRPPQQRGSGYDRPIGNLMSFSMGQQQTVPSSTPWRTPGALPQLNPVVPTPTNGVSHEYTTSTMNDGGRLPSRPLSGLQNQAYHLDNNVSSSFSNVRPPIPSPVPPRPISQNSVAPTPFYPQQPTFIHGSASELQQTGQAPPALGTYNSFSGTTAPYTKNNVGSNHPTNPFRAEPLNNGTGQVFNPPFSAIASYNDHGNPNHYSVTGGGNNNLMQRQGPGCINPVPNAASPLPVVAKSTAPTAGVSRITPGMPVPWPIPTGTQQVGSTTQSTAPANQKIHEILNPSQPEGVPMGITDLNFVQKVLCGSLESQIQSDPHNTRKHEDIRLKLSELFNQLQAGNICKINHDLILQYCKAMELGDVSAATLIQAQLTRMSWNKESRNWLMALKRLLTK